MATVTSGGTQRPARNTLDPRRWVALTLLCLCQLMLVIDVTVVNVALPDIGADLHLRGGSLPWVMTAYTLVFGGLMLLGGRLSDVFGARRVLLTGLTVFTIASLLSGLSGAVPTLLGGRAAQGLGAALMSPAALSLLTTRFDGPDRARALGVWSAISGAGAALGVVLGGVLTSGVGWRWVFFINVPIGLALLVVVPTLFPAAASPGRRAPVDVPGALIVTAATGAAIYGLINVGGHGWSATSTLVPLAASALLYALFAVIESAVTVPLMRVGLLTRRPVAAASSSMLVATGLLVGGFFLGSFYLQREHGYSALQTGLAFLPIALGTAVGAHFASRAVTRVHARTLTAVGLALAGLGSGAAALWPGPVSVVLGLTVAALGIGATFVTAFTAALAGVAAHESGLRSAVVNTFHELGGAVGVAVVSGVAAGSLTAAHGGTAGFSRAFAVCAIAAFAASVLGALVVPAGKATPGLVPRGH